MYLVNNKCNLYCNPSTLRESFFQSTLDNIRVKPILATFSKYGKLGRLKSCMGAIGSGPLFARLVHRNLVTGYHT